MALCAQAGVPVCAIPGPCAVITALSVSGLPTGRFTFEGFLSTNRKSRTDHLDSLRAEQRTMVFYEAPHKLLHTLEDMAAVFGEGRRISLCRELTKLHEEILRTTLGEAIALYRETPPRGEFVLVVEGAEAPPAQQATLEEAVALVAALMEQGRSRKDAAKEAAAQTGFSKNALYSASMEG